MSREVAFFLVGTLLFIGSGATQSYVVAYLQSLGYPPFFGTIVLAVIYVFQIPTRFFIGYIERWIGPRYSLIIGTAGYFFYALLFALATTWWHYPLVMAMWGVTSAIFWTEASVVLLNTSAEERYGRAMGAFYAGAGVGPAVGVLIMSWLMANYGGRSIFFFSAIPAVFAVGIMASLDLEKKGRAEPIHGRTFWGFLKDPEVLTVVLLLFIRSFSYGLVYGSFGSLIASRMGLEWIGPLTCSFYILSGIFSRFGGALSDIIGRRTTFVISFMMGGIGALLLFFSNSKTAFVLASALLGFQASTVTVNANAWVGNTARPEERSNLMAFIGGANAVGVVISLLLNGFFLGSAAMSRLGFILFAVANIVAGVGSHLMVKAARPAGGGVVVERGSCRRVNYPH